MGDSRVVRVAVTLEQCWHRVPGGTARATLDAAAAVAERGDVDQVGVAAIHRRPAPEDWAPPIPVRSLPLPRLLLYESWHRLRRPAVQRATGPVDVVHATAHVAAPASAPLVATVHDLHFLHEPAHFTPRGVRVFRRFLELIRDEASVVVCPSDATRADCLAAGIDAGRLRVVPWAVRSGRDDEARPPDVRDVYGLQKRSVLFAGTVEPRKNLSRLLDAVERLGRDDVELVLVGPSGWGEVGDRPGVRRLGFLPRAHLEGLYEAADVVCYPSIREGFGLPVLEAMARGAPVVTSSGTSMAEVGGDAVVLVDPLDVDSIAGGIARVLDDADLAATLRRRGPERAAQYSWSRTAEGLAGAYRDASSAGMP